MVDTFRLSPDKLTYTFILRNGLKWHDGQPVRAIDAVASLKRWAVKDAAGQKLMAKTALLEAVDDKTLVLKLKEPIVYIPNWFASFGSFTGQIIMYPKEADSSFNLSNDIIGTGPFQLKSHQPSVNFILERNPDYWDKDAAIKRLTDAYGDDAGAEIASALG